MSASNISSTTVATINTNINFDLKGVLKKSLSFKKLVDEGNFEEASKFFSDTDFTRVLPAYFESIIRPMVTDLPSILTDYSCPLEKKRALSRIVAAVEFFEKNGIDVSYNRLCCAAACLSLGEKAKLEQRLPGICQPREKDSDFYILNQMLDNNTDRTLCQVFFRPLQEAVRKYASQTSASFSLAHLSQKA